MEPIGRTNCSVSCTPFVIHTDSDYIEKLIFHYNTTGGYGLSIFTKQGDSALYGITQERSDISKFILRIEWHSTGPKFTIVGLAGTVRGPTEGG